jgi:hypothetical protein
MQAVTGSGSDQTVGCLNVCGVLTVILIGSALIGSILGFFLRGRIGWEILLSATASGFYMLAVEWCSGPLKNVWSAYNFGLSLLNHVAPYLLLCFAPCFITALFVGALRES